MDEQIYLSDKSKRLYRRFRSFPAYTKVLVVVALVVVLPLLVYLVRSFTLYLSRASAAQLSFSQAQINLPPNATIGVMANSGNAQIAFARVEVSFDQTKVNLSDEIQITGPLRAVIGKTSKADANTNGHLVVVVALCNAIDIPCSNPAPQAPSGSFELVKLPLTAVSSQSGQTTLSFDVLSSQLVDTNQANVALTGTNSTVNLNTSITRPVTSTPGGTGTPNPNLQAATTLTLTSIDAIIGLNQNSPVNVQINTSTNSVIGVDLDITFDPSLLILNNITAGSFFTNPDITNKVIDNSGGHAKVTISIPPGTNARQGAGTLAVLNFKGKALGGTRIDFGTDTLVAATNMEGQNALRSAAGLDINVVTCAFIMGDINRDGVVDIVDYVILFANFGKNPAGSGVDARADINIDGKINILDYTYVFENFGKSCE